MSKMAECRRISSEPAFSSPGTISRSSRLALSGANFDDPHAYLRSPIPEDGEYDSFSKDDLGAAGAAGDAKPRIRELNIQKVKGDTFGIKLHVNEKNLHFIIHVAEGTGAWYAGLSAGDRIDFVNELPTSTMR